MNAPDWKQRYSESVMNTYGEPQRMLVRGEGVHVWDADGRQYLDLLGGIAVNTLGHAHPALSEAVTGQLATLGHISNFFASAPQTRLAERLIELLDIGSTPARVFFANSGAEANEAAFKIARRTGRRSIVALDGGFHGRTMGALAMTGKPSITEPFEPLPGGVTHVPPDDLAALRGAVGPDTAALVLEPIQGESGVRPLSNAYLQAARELTTQHGALLIVDEVQTGLGRTGAWFAHHTAGIRPDVVTVAKGLGAGIPVGACIGIGAAADLLGPGSHGTTFGGNPVAAAAGLAVLDVIERDNLLEQARKVGEHIAESIAGLGHPSLAGPARGAGLLLGVPLRGSFAPALAGAALNAGFIVNPVNPETIRLAPPLILTAADAEPFVSALPDLLDHVAPRTVHAPDTPQAGSAERR
ncbi:MAG TPA: acetylornithine transaminase [Jiangellaceae bacterium]|nr:acetylornithine transaminase [Jiangellaceae bacterium]